VGVIASKRPQSRRHGVASGVYFAVLLIAAVVVLPSALRPPPDPAQQSAELSPDAPPDEQQDAIVAALNRGSTATAGQTIVNGKPVDVTIPPAPPRACPSGRGDPPRQVESLYAASCAPAFVGDNGGATSKGVTPTEIRIAINGTNAGSSDPCADGRLPTTPPPGECESDRTFRVLQQYFNQNFQLYGRHIQFYVAQSDTTDEPAIRAAAVKADEEYKVFGAGFVYAPGCQELTHRKIVNFCSQQPKSEYERSFPYMWGWDMNGTDLVTASAEFVCKRYVGKPAIYAGDPTMHAKKRKFGNVFFASRGYESLGPLFSKKLRECGAEVVDVAATLDTQDGTAGLGQAIARFIAEGVTTVIPGMDAVSQIALTNQAANNGYLPEWFANGAGANTFNAIAELMNQTEWAHAFGITPFEDERPNDFHDCYRAYRSIDPGGTPNYTICKGLFYHLLQLVNGIQLAGPKLTPESFAQGMFKKGLRFWDHPTWAVGGGYAPGFQTYIQNLAVVWYDPTTQDPQYLNSAGAYWYENGGKRYKLGELPAEDRAFNKENASTTPADAGEFDGR
jgi:hypothetical protein